MSHGVRSGNSLRRSLASSPSGYNATYIALPGTTGTTLVGEIATGGGTCPGAVSVEGTALSGAGGEVTLTAISTTNPWGTNQTTGITTQPGAHFCGVFGEYGADSPTPGFQFAAFTDLEGNALPEFARLSFLA